MQPAIFCTVLLALSVIGGAQPGSARLTGMVTYRERIALTADAVLEITLEDTTRADAPATIIARRSINTPGQVPIAFELPYDPTQLMAGRRYAVRARILDRGELAFISTQAYVIDPASPATPLAILVQAARTPVAGAPAAEPVIEDRDWVLAQVFGRAVPFGVDVQDARFRLVKAQQRLQGSTGCNNIFGAYERRESRLAFKGVGGTMMACAPPTMEQEALVLKALQATASFRLADGKLDLLDASGTVVAQLTPTR